MFSVRGGLRNARSICLNSLWADARRFSTRSSLESLRADTSFWLRRLYSAQFLSCSVSQPGQRRTRNGSKREQHGLKFRRSTASGFAGAVRRSFSVLHGGLCFQCILMGRCLVPERLLARTCQGPHAVMLLFSGGGEPLGGEQTLARQRHGSRQEYVCLLPRKGRRQAGPEPEEVNGEGSTAESRTYFGLEETSPSLLYADVRRRFPGNLGRARG